MKNQSRKKKKRLSKIKRIRFLKYHHWYLIQSPSVGKFLFKNMYKKLNKKQPKTKKQC